MAAISSFAEAEAAGRCEPSADPGEAPRPTASLKYPSNPRASDRRGASRTRFAERARKARSAATERPRTIEGRHLKGKIGGKADCPLWGQPSPSGETYFRAAASSIRAVIVSGCDAALSRVNPEI